MFLLKKLMRFFYVQMMIKECNQLIRQNHMHMERADLVGEKEEIKSNNIIKQYINDYL